MSNSWRIGFFPGGGSAVSRIPGSGRHLGLFHFFAGGGERLGGPRVVELGYLKLERYDLEPFRASEESLRVRVLGVLRLDNDLSPALAEAALGRVQVLGWVRADSRTAAVVRSKASGDG